MNTEYPQLVEEALVEWQEALKDPEFLLEQDINPAYVISSTRSVFGPAILEQWLKTGKPIIMEKDAENLIRKFIVDALLAELKDKGYVDSIEDEHGEEIYWATAEGKAYKNKVLNK